MNQMRKNLILLLGAIAPALMLAEADVSAPSHRTAVLDQARKLTGSLDANVAAGVKSPFAMTGSEASGGAAAGGAAETAATGTVRPPRPSGPRSDAELLAAIAGAIKPSGYFVIGGEPTIVFGQKKVKQGGAVTINFEGADYSVEITAINRTSFTLRYNREEFTRPIK